MRTIFSACSMALLALIAGCANTTTGTTSPTRTTADSQPEFVRQSTLTFTRSISAQATSTLYVKPDEVTVHFAVETADRELAKAKSANDSAARATLDLIKSLQIDERDVQTQAMKSGREYEQRPDGSKNFTGYQVTREYAVRVRDLSRFEALMDALLARNEITDQAYDFSTTQREATMARARREAIAKARERAETAARELHCRIGAPSQISVSDQNSSYRGGSLFGGGGGGLGGSAQLPGVTPLGEIEVNATIDVTFDLIPER